MLHFAVYVASIQKDEPALSVILALQYLPSTCMKRCIDYCRPCGGSVQHIDYCRLAAVSCKLISLPVCGEARIYFNFHFVTNVTGLRVERDAQRSDPQYSPL